MLAYCKDDCVESAHGCHIVFHHYWSFPHVLSSGGFLSLDHVFPETPPLVGIGCTFPFWKTALRNSTVSPIHYLRHIRTRYQLEQTSWAPQLMKAVPSTCGSSKTWRGCSLGSCRCMATTGPSMTRWVPPRCDTTSWMLNEINVKPGEIRGGVWLRAYVRTYVHIIPINSVRYRNRYQNRRRHDTDNPKTLHARYTFDIWLFILRSFRSVSTKIITWGCEGMKGKTGSIRYVCVSNDLHFNTSKKSIRCPTPMQITGSFCGFLFGLVLFLLIICMRFLSGRLCRSCMPPAHSSGPQTDSFLFLRGQMSV